MSEKYKIIIERESVNHVKVFKHNGEGYTNDWNFLLKGDDEPIVFSEFFSETKFILINWNGWIRVYDADSSETLFDKKLDGDTDAKAVFSLDKKQLYVVYVNDSSQTILTIVSLDSFAIQTKELNVKYGNNLAIRKDGNLLLYKHDYKRIDDQKIYEHFYSVLDMTCFEVEKFELPFAPPYSYNEFIPVVDFENNTVIMPAYADVPSKTTESGEMVFEYRIVLFDANTFEVLKVLSVRDFQKNQLSYYPNDGDRITELFLNPERNKKYRDEQREFYDNLNTIKLVANGMWLCFRGGILRKVHTDFTVSPLLVTASLRNSSDGMFQYPYFHSHLYQIDEKSIVLAEALDFYISDMPSLVNVDSKIPIALAFVPATQEEIYKMSYTAEQEIELEYHDFFPIEVTDLSTHTGLEEALFQIENIVSDLEAAGVGSVLKFIFKDASGNTIHEPYFFEKTTPQAPAIVQKLIEKLIQNSKLKYVYRNAEETALCYAVYELAKQDESYLTTIIKYLSAIDMDHDVFNRENLLPLLEEKYTPKGLSEKIKTVSQNFAEWYDYYCEEMHEG